MRSGAVSFLALCFASLAGAAPAAVDCPLPVRGVDPDAAHREALRAADLLASSLDCSPHERARVCTEPPPRVNFIDDEIFDRLAEARIAPAPLASDLAFLRRVTLDLVGRIPTEGEIALFRSTPQEARRDLAIERLLASEELVSRWTFFYDELFRNVSYSETSYVQIAGRNAWHAYFADRIRRGVGFDDMAAEMIASHGNSFVDGQANFLARELVFNGPAQDTMDGLAVATGRAMLGVDMFCVTCHDGRGHTDTLDLWLTERKREDLWRMSAYYSRLAVGFRQWDSYQYALLFSQRPDGDYALDTTDGNKTPREGWIPGVLAVGPRFVLDGSEPGVGENRMRALAAKVASHPQLARAAANRVWKAMFGVGIVEPADAFDLARQDPADPPPAPWRVQPSHPRLLDRLAEEYRASGFDLRHLLRSIARSSTYQLSAFHPGPVAPPGELLFERRFPRRLGAEEIYDSIATATGVWPPLPVIGAMVVRRAIDLPDSWEPFFADDAGNGTVRGFLDGLGRGNRDLRRRNDAGTVVAALTLLDDPVVTDRVRATTPGSLVGRVLRSSPAEAVERLYLATLTRTPTADEMARALERLGAPSDGARYVEALEDLHFTLIQRIELLFHH